MNWALLDAPWPCYWGPVIPTVECRCLTFAFRFQWLERGPGRCRFEARMGLNGLSLLSLGAFRARGPPQRLFRPNAILAALLAAVAIPFLEERRPIAQSLSQGVQRRPWCGADCYGRCHGSAVACRPRPEAKNTEIVRWALLRVRHPVSPPTAGSAADRAPPAFAQGSADRSARPAGLGAAYPIQSLGSCSPLRRKRGLMAVLL